MAEPAIKGTLFEAVIEDVMRLIDSEGITREELEARVRAEDLALLDEKISAAGWYDIHSYHRLVGVLWEVEGEGRVDYWFKRGERAAERLAARGIYQQLEYLGRMAESREPDPELRFKSFAKDMRLLMTLHAAMLNFGEWQCVVDPDAPDRYRVEIAGIGGIPDGIFEAAAGMFSALGRLSRGDGSSKWIYDRVSPDLALMRMTGPV
jgi:hypothetical protein